MKERPIIFNDMMVRAILDGRKTQTRRIVKCGKHNPIITHHDGMRWWDGKHWRDCPYGMPGDHLWVRENACYTFDTDGDTGELQGVCRYTADLDEPHKHNFYWTGFSGEFSGVGGCTGNKASIFMPRWASRILLEIVNIHDERVQKISNADVIAEGFPFSLDSIAAKMDGMFQSAYKGLWNSINEKSGYGWDKNPFVWVIEFKIIEVKA